MSKTYVAKFSEQIKTSNTDEWYTLKEPVEIIVPYLFDRGYKRILCPFDKAESNFVIVLKEYGFDVTYSHIDDGVDFFDLDLNGYDAVVSNPPFSKRQKILEKLFDADIPFALILNFNGLFDSKTRWQLFSRNKFELLVPCGRWHFANDVGEANSPNFQSIYVCKGMGTNQIEFLNSQSNYHFPKDGETAEEIVLRQVQIGDELARGMREGFEHYANINNVDDCVETVRYADTIIEADKEEE